MPTLEAVQPVPTPVELETSFSETKVEVSSKDTQSTEPDLEPSGIEPIEPAVIKEAASVFATLVDRKQSAWHLVMGKFRPRASEVLESTAPVVTKEAIDHQGSVQQQSDTTTVIPEVLAIMIAFMYTCT